MSVDEFAVKKVAMAGLDARLVGDFIEVNLDAFGEFLEENALEATEAQLIVEAIKKAVRE